MQFVFSLKVELNHKLHIRDLKLSKLRKFNLHIIIILKTKTLYFITEICKYKQ